MVPFSFKSQNIRFTSNFIVLASPSCSFVHKLSRTCQKLFVTYSSIIYCYTWYHIMPVIRFTRFEEKPDIF